ncbi:MAG: hypothetical protein KF911_04715 [Pseudomonadales bacterium]|nr:hypothetical protein [Pseudomonadales bacterium]
MIIGTGEWLGRGSLLADGQSRGRILDAEVQIRREEGAVELGGRWTLAGDAPVEFSIRVVQNEAGTWTIGLRAGALRLHGTAKLESAPNLALLWNDAGNLHLTVALFALPDGVGCRGFVREGTAVHTWELLLESRRQALGGPNVVTLHRRRPR